MAVENLYVRLEPVYLSAQLLYEYSKRMGISNPVLPHKIHSTVAFSKTRVEWKYGERELFKTIDLDQKTFKLEVFPGHPDRLGQREKPRNALVLLYGSVEVVALWKYFRALGASYDYPHFRPHITLSYDWDGDESFRNWVTPDFPIIFTKEVSEGLIL